MAARQEEKKAQRKKDSRVLASVAVAAVVLIGGGVFAFVRFAPRSWLHQASGHARSSASAQAAPAVKLTAQPVGPVGTGGPPGDPFSGTPADHWADGTAAITVPAATAHGPYTAAQVRSAYETTREMLITGNLDWPTLRGGDPKPFEKLLTRSQLKQFLAGLHTTKVDKSGADENTREWITSFAPGSTQFVTMTVKVHGTMKASAVRESGEPVLRITADYLFVYVVEPPGDPADWMRVVQQQSGTVEFARWDESGSSFEPWYGLGGAPSGVRCDKHDGYIYPDFATGPPSTVQPSGKPVDPYSLATEAPGGGCRSTTGT